MDVKKLKSCEKRVPSDSISILKSQEHSPIIKTIGYSLSFNYNQLWKYIIVDELKAVGWISVEDEEEFEDMLVEIYVSEKTHSWVVNTLNLGEEFGPLSCIGFSMFNYFCSKNQLRYVLPNKYS
jgi:hypothetical protein